MATAFENEIQAVESQIEISMRHKLWDAVTYWGLKLQELIG